MPSWTEQFQKALDSQDQDAVHWVEQFGGLDEVLKEKVDTTAEGFDLCRVAMRTAGLRRLGELAETWLNYCQSESPIERAMYWALFMVGDEIAETISLRVGKYIHGDGFGALAPTEALIEQQVTIGSYRVDFVITVRQRWGYDEYADAQVIVECDGHDYHDRTKEQARRDKSRDRELQAAGYPVLRFTGSEIWANPLTCAAEAIQLARANANRKLQA